MGDKWANKSAIIDHPQDIAGFSLAVLISAVILKKHGIQVTRKSAMPTVKEICRRYKDYGIKARTYEEVLVQLEELKKLHEEGLVKLPEAK
jgi:hypothetical protein